MTGWLSLAAVLASLVLLSSQDGTSAGEPTGDASRGETLYQANCAMCHGPDATGMMGMHPTLRGVVDRLTVEGVEVTIRQGRDTRPPMPAFGDQLDDDDIADLIAYLHTLPPGPRNFGPQARRAPIDDQGMGARMRDMMGGGMAALWVVIVVLAAALAGVIGYLIGQRRR
jgi:mono/diheme cytochrome c family protein